jgi:deoxyribose-phosphate aldolase
MSIAQFIDHTILKPTTILGDIERVCNEAIEYGFAAVCIPPYYVKDAVQILSGSKPRIATVIGFPFGYHHYTSKEAEVLQALIDGAHEVDVVMNIAAFKSNDMAYLESEIDAITKITVEKNAIVKVIIESGVLNEDEIIKCCELYRHYPVHFLKTSTGYADHGASIEAVHIMRQHLPASIQIKASGGIRDFSFAKNLIQAGATRLGCSAGVAIVKEERTDGDRKGRPSHSPEKDERGY